MPDIKNNLNQTEQTGGDQQESDSKYEFNSYFGSSRLHELDCLFGCAISSHFTSEEIKAILADPIGHHELTRKLAMFVYNSEGVVTNAIDYMVSMPCLDRVICGKKRVLGKYFGKNKLEKYKDLMRSTLETIDDKKFIRDVLFTDMNEGTSFYYFETSNMPVDRTRNLNDFDVDNIVELCDLGMNAVMMPLPYEWCQIIGRKNGRNVVAFNLRYFDEFAGQAEQQRKLKKFPQEIRKAYHEWKNADTNIGNWHILDVDHTFTHKIKCKISEPWGRPLAIAAIIDILYKDEFVDTKRNVLRELNNKIIYQTFPEGRDKSVCALTETQQKNQHAKVKEAVMTKNNRGGTSFFSVAAGTKINVVDVSATEIFDGKNEDDLTDNIAMDLGMAAALLNGSGSGNYSSQQNNLELINAQIYTWVQEIQNELNYIINKCIIKDRKKWVEVYYLPTSLVNRKNFFEMMKSLYLEASGSLTFLIASTGVNPDIYFNVLDEELDNKIFDKYVPHQTAYTQTGKVTNDKGGRPENDNPTNERTIQSKLTNSNDMPKPSTK